MEQAGGKGSTGTSRILDIQPKTLHDHVSTFLGSKADVEEIEKYIARYDKPKVL
jgi:fructose-1,6-bisphosphatase I